MKKLAAILLILCYLVPAIGTTLVMHYCGGELDSVSILSTDENRCSCGSESMKKDCCKDELVVLKIKDTEQSIKSSTTQPRFIVKEPAATELLLQSVYFNPVSLSFSQSYLYPPGAATHPVYLVNKVFLI